MFKAGVTQEVIECRRLLKMRNLMPVKLIVYEAWNLINGKGEKVSYFRTFTFIIDPLSANPTKWSNIV